MMQNSAVSTIKREQKTSFLLKEISAMVQELTPDEPSLLRVFVTKITMSKDCGICFVHFSTYGGKEEFDEALQILKLYKPSMRRRLAQISHSKYTPNIMFMYDQGKDKERHINTLLDGIAVEEGNAQ
jgi:ribosome-binding factor A